MKMLETRILPPVAAAVQVADIRFAGDGDGRGVIAGRVSGRVRRWGSGSNGQESGDQKLNLNKNSNHLKSFFSN